MPLFPGESDLDTLHHISTFVLNHSLASAIGEGSSEPDLESRVAGMDDTSMDLLKRCLRLEANERPPAAHLMMHPYFDNFREGFDYKIKQLVALDKEENFLGGLSDIPSQSSFYRGNKDEAGGNTSDSAREDSATYTHGELEDDFMAEA